MALRLAAFALAAAAVSAAWLGAAPWLSRRARVAWAGRCTGAFHRAVLAILGIRLRIAGAVPEGPCLVVANHLGYLDVTALAASLDCAFVAKSEVAAWPVFGALAAWSGTLFLDRRRAGDLARVNAQVARRLADGGRLALFPEGTSGDGTAPLPFRSSLLAVPAAAGIPVHAAAIRYLAPPGAPPASACMGWWGDMDFLPHFLGLFRLRGMAIEVAFAEEPERAPDRKVLAARLHATVASLLAGGGGDGGDAGGRTLREPAAAGARA